MSAAPTHPLGGSYRHADCRYCERYGHACGRHWTPPGVPAPDVAETVHAWPADTEPYVVIVGNAWFYYEGTLMAAPLLVGGTPDWTMTCEVQVDAINLPEMVAAVRAALDGLEVVAAAEAAAAAAADEAARLTASTLVGRLVIAADDDRPFPVVGHVVGQLDEDRLEVAWGDERFRDPAERRVRVQCFDELAPYCETARH